MITNITLERHVVCKVMFIITQLSQSWCKHTMCSHVLHISAYCAHHLVHRAFTFTFLLCAVPPYTGQCLHTFNALYRYAVCMLYNVLNITNLNF
jgi:hypothetical protein